MKLLLYENKDDQKPVTTIDEIASDTQAIALVRSKAQELSEIAKWALVDDLGDRCVWCKKANSSSFEVLLATRVQQESPLQKEKSH